MKTNESQINNLVNLLDGYTEHNLVRARTQFKLVAEMEEQFELMNEILEKYI